MQKSCNAKICSSNKEKLVQIGIPILRMILIENAYIGDNITQSATRHLSLILSHFLLDVYHNMFKCSNLDRRMIRSYSIEIVFQQGEDNQAAP